jgi:hypothetical protein
MPVQIGPGALKPMIWIMFFSLNRCKSLCRKDLGLAASPRQAVSPYAATTYDNSKNLFLFS